MNNHSKKLSISKILILLICFGIFSSGFSSFANSIYIPASTTFVNIALNNQSLDFGFCQPYVDSKDQIMIPLRFMVEALGSQVGWEEATERVVISNDNLVLKLKINERFISRNDEIVPLNSPMVYNPYYDRNYIPLSFLSVYLGATVNSRYDDKTQTVNVSIQGANLMIIPDVEVARGAYDHNPNPLNKDNLKLSLAIDMSSSQIEFLMGKPLRKDTHAFIGETWVYRKKGLLSYLYFKNSKVMAVFVTGEDWKTERLMPGMSIEQVKKIVPILNRQSVKFGDDTCTVIQDVVTTPKKYISINDNIATEFLFDTKTKSLIALRISKIEQIIASGAYGLEWCFKGDKSHIEMPLLSEQLQVAVDQSAQRQILDLTNVIRESYGLNGLTINPRASQIALGHSKDMYQNKYVAHISPKYGSLLNRYQKAGIPCSFLAENIAYGSFDGIEAVYSWLHSDGHRQNLLSPKSKSIGIGVVKNYYTQNFITQNSTK